MQYNKTKTMSVLLTNTFADIHCNFGNMEVTRYVQIKQKKALNSLPNSSKLEVKVASNKKVKSYLYSARIDTGF